MLICCECGHIFSEDDLEYERVCWEDYYGVGSMFPNKNYGEIPICPECGSDELGDYYEDEDDGEEEEDDES